MKKGRILLAEENRLSVLAITNMLNNKIECLDWVSNSKKLIQKYQSEQQYDLILLNTWLENSLGITRKIRAREAAPNGKFTPIIGLFSEWVEDKHFRSAIYRQYFKAGMNDVFPQTLTNDDIDKILEKYIL